MRIYPLLDNWCLLSLSLNDQLSNMNREFSNKTKNTKYRLNTWEQQPKNFSDEDTTIKNNWCVLFKL